MYSCIYYLLDAVVGHFIVRNASSDVEDYVLSVKSGPDSVQHLKITLESSLRYSIDHRQSFSTVTELINFHLNSEIIVDGGHDGNDVRISLVMRPRQMLVASHA